MRRRLVRLVSPLLIVGLSACAARQRTATSQDLSQRRWVLVTTEHFRVYSDIEDVEALAAGLEQDVTLIAQAAFESPAVSVEQTDVVVFAKGEHFHRYFPKSSGGISYPRLPLLPESHHTVVTFQRASGANLQTSLRHKLVHDIYARNFGAAPPWLAEGFAEYFSTVQLVGGQIHVGAPLPDRVLTKDSHPFVVRNNGTDVLAIPNRSIPTPGKLLTMSAEDFYGSGKPSDEFGSSPETMANYFGAWAFVHFLMDARTEYFGRFQTFLTVVRTTSVRLAWEGAFAGVNPEKLDDQFRDYLTAGQLTISAVPYRQPLSGAAPKVRTLGEGEKHVLLAKLALALSPSPAGAQEFSQEVEAAVRSDPPPSEAYYLRGMLARSLGEDADAKRDFQNALRLAPDDPRARRASLALQLEQLDGQLYGEDLIQFHAAIEKLEQLATSPSELLFAAQFHAATGETERAMALGTRAIAINPVEPTVLEQYARVLELCGHLEQAVVTLRRALEFTYDHRSMHQHLARQLERMESLLAQRTGARREIEAQ